MKKRKQLIFISTLFVVTLLIIGLLGCDNPSKKLEANKNLIHRFTEAVNAADGDALDVLLPQDFKRHCQATPDVRVNSREEFITLTSFGLAAIVLIFSTFFSVSPI